MCVRFWKQSTRFSKGTLTGSDGGILPLLGRKMLINGMIPRIEDPILRTMIVTSENTLQKKNGRRLHKRLNNNIMHHQVIDAHGGGVGGSWWR